MLITLLISGAGFAKKKKNKSPDPKLCSIETVVVLGNSESANAVRTALQEGRTWMKLAGSKKTANAIFDVAEARSTEQILTVITYVTVTVELINGRVLLDARQNSGNFRRRHLSTDGGVTWGPDSPDDIPITPVDISMVRYSAKRATHDRNRILFSGPRGESGLNRNNITVWTSYDEGKTFTNPVQFNNGFAAYSVVQRLADGTIGLVVETANNAAVRYGEITFYRFDIAELEAEVRRQ